MTPEKKALYRLMFHAKLSKTTGMAFQNLFSEIMQYAGIGFIPVKPQGSIGDQKNDGYIPSAGKYFQVYSPEIISESAAITKLEDDFSGLVVNWQDSSVYTNGVKSFAFVLNDHFRVIPGGYPTTLKTLEKLKQKHSLDESTLMLAKDLEDLLLSLDEDKIISVVGYAPNPADIDVLEFSLVNEVVSHIIENTIIRSLNQTWISPDFETKLTFNNLKATAPWLIDANYRSGTLEDYFQANSQFTRQELRDKLKAIYESSKQYSFSNTEAYTSSDERLVFILNEITPVKPIANKRMFKELQDAALVVMAYFFETCDVFDEPINASAQ